jgi:membrane-associated protease RseP (regulator of RpoE activity)
LPNYDPTQTGLNISYSNDIQRDIHAALRHGYAVVGESAFHGNMNQAKEGGLRAQARKVGATLVIVASKQTGTQTGAVPLVLPNNSTTYSTGSATAYGPGGMVNAYGSSTSTTYGTQTMMLPYTIQLGEFDAIYFVKTKMRTGLFPREVPEDVKRSRQSNFGVQVFEVAEGTAAFQADIMSGDIVVSVGGQKVESVAQYGSLLDKFGNTTTTFVLERDGKTFEKQLFVKTLSQ